MAQAGLPGEGNRCCASSGFLSRHVNIVAQVLKSKPDHSVYTTMPMASMFDAITLMAENGR